MTHNFLRQNFEQTREVYSRSQQTTYTRDGKIIPKPKLTPEQIDRDALATLLYSGMVNPPKTIFKDYLAIGMGGTLEIDNDEYSYNESEDLFASSHSESTEVDTIDLLAQAIERRKLDFGRCRLLLSEGKDSTAIAIAFAELGAKINCVTFANADTNIDFIKSIAKRFGHQLDVIRYSNLKFNEDALLRLGKVFEPTVDQAFLSYLLLPLNDFHDCVLIDGMGNDIYMGHLPTPSQVKATRVCGFVEKLVPQSLRETLKPHAFPNSPSAGIPFRTFSECQGLYNGFGKALVERSTGGSVSMPIEIDNHWKSLGYQKARALSRGRYLDTYSFAGKTIALAEMASATAYFPWMDQSIATHFAGLSDRAKFTWPLTNKLLLRKSINRRMKYTQPKVGFLAPVTEIFNENLDLLYKAVDQSQMLGKPLKQSIDFRSPYRNRAVSCALLALWEQASRV